MGAPELGWTYRPGGQGGRKNRGKERLEFKPEIVSHAKEVQEPVRALSDGFDSIPVRGMEDSEANHWGNKTCRERDELSFA